MPGDFAIRLRVATARIWGAKQGPINIAPDAREVRKPLSVKTRLLPAMVHAASMRGARGSEQQRAQLNAAHAPVSDATWPHPTKTDVSYTGNCGQFVSTFGCIKYESRQLIAGSLLPLSLYLTR